MELSLVALLCQEKIRFLEKNAFRFNLGHKSETTENSVFRRDFKGFKSKI